MDHESVNSNNCRKRARKNTSSTINIARTSVSANYLQPLHALSDLATELYEGRVNLTNEDEEHRYRLPDNPSSQVVPSLNSCTNHHGIEEASDSRTPSTVTEISLSSGISSRTVYERFFDSFTSHSNSHQTSRVLNCFIQSTQPTLVTKLKYWNKHDLLQAISGSRSAVVNSATPPKCSNLSTSSPLPSLPPSHDSIKNTTGMVNVAKNPFGFANNMEFNELKDSQLQLIQQVISKVFELLPDMVYSHGDVRVLDTINDQTRVVAPISIRGTVVMHTQLPTNSSSSSNSIPISISFDLLIEGYHMVWFDIRNDHRISKWDYHYFVSKLTNNTN